MKKYNLKQGIIYLEITSKCNLHCPYCYNESNYQGSDMPIEKVKEIIDYSVQCNIKNLSISGGEPFMHKNFFDILKYAVNNKIHVNIVSNGAIVSKENINKFLKYKNEISIQLTFDGHNEKIHSITRGKDNFSKTLKFMDLLIENGLSDRIYIRYNTSMNNYMYIEDFISLMVNHGCKNVHIAKLLNQGRATEEDNYEKLSIEDQQEKIFTLVNKLKDKYKDINIKSDDKEVVICPYFIVKENQDLMFNPRIDSHGNVYPCQLEVDSSDIVGNIYKNTLDEIIKSDTLKKYITNNNNLKQNDVCKKCLINNICGGGCHVLNRNCSRIKAQVFRGFINESSNTIH